jgi:His-Xaa-Ser system protein HxsD
VSAMPEGFSSEPNSEVSTTIRLDSRIYSKEAILRTVLWFTDIAYVYFDESSAERFVVQVRLKSTAASLNNPRPPRIQDVVGEFCNSLLEFELRRQVETETAPIRQLILAKAFSESGILEEDPPGNFSDPVGIDRPDSIVQISDKLPAPSRG